MTSFMGNVVLDPTTPYDSALAFIEMKYSNPSAQALRYYQGEFFHWTGTHYMTIDIDTIRAEIYDFLDTADCPDKQGGTIPFKPTSRRASDVLDALKAAANLRARVAVPSWIRNDPDICPTELIACTNGLLHIPSRRLLAHTPDFFNLVSVPFPYEASAPEPVEWLSFLTSLWGDDVEAIATLQENFWLFSYVRYISTEAISVDWTNP
jgi:putative DNA primase/helicase